MPPTPSEAQDTSDFLINRLIETGAFDLSKFLLRHALTTETPITSYQRQQALKRRESIDDDRNQYILYLIKDFLLNMGLQRTWETLLLELDRDDLDDSTEEGGYCQKKINSKLMQTCKPLVKPSAVTSGFEDDTEIAEEDKLPYTFEHRASSEQSLLHSFVIDAWSTKQQLMQCKEEITNNQWIIAEKTDPQTTAAFKAFQESLKQQHTNNNTQPSLTNHIPQSLHTLNTNPPVSTTPTKQSQGATDPSLSQVNRPSTPKRTTTQSASFAGGLARGKSPVRITSQGSPHHRGNSGMMPLGDPSISELGSGLSFSSFDSTPHQQQHPRPAHSPLRSGRAGGQHYTFGPQATQSAVLPTVDTQTPMTTHQVKIPKT